MWNTLALCTELICPDILINGGQMNQTYVKRIWCLLLQNQVMSSKWVIKGLNDVFSVKENTRMWQAICLKNSLVVVYKDPLNYSLIKFVFSLRPEFCQPFQMVITFKNKKQIRPNHGLIDIFK